MDFAYYYSESGLFLCLRWKFRPKYSDAAVSYQLECANQSSKRQYPSRYFGFSFGSW